MGKSVALIFICCTLYQYGNAQINGFLQMQISGPVHFVVQDSQGRKSGRDPRTGESFDEIPNAGYGFSGVDSHDEDAESIEFWEFGFNSPIDDPTFRELYVATVIGTEKGTFHGLISMAQSLSGKGADYDIRGLIDSNQTFVFSFSYSTDTTIVPTFQKNVDIGTLRADLENAFILALLGDKSFYQQLSHRIDEIEKHRFHKDRSKAGKELEKFEEQLDRAHSETAKHLERDQQPPHFVKQEAYEVLKEDVTLLQSQFVGLE